MLTFHIYSSLTEQLKAYLTQLRVETADRFVKIAYVDDQPNKVCPGFRKKRTGSYTDLQTTQNP